MIARQGDADGGHAKRFCWHRWQWHGPEWEDSNVRSLYQRKRCVKCGKERSVVR
jgi:hypothetical protein